MSRRRRNVMRRSAAEREQLAELDPLTHDALEANVSEHGLDEQTPEAWRAVWSDKP